MPSDFGSIELVSSSQVEAGEPAVIELRYTAGNTVLESGGTITIDTESDSDWGRPQLADSGSDDFLVVSPPLGCSVSIHTPDHKTSVITVQSGRVAAGESVLITLGGGSGLRTQTFFEIQHYFRCHVNPTGEGASTPIDPVVVEVIGGQIESLSAIAPSDIELGSEFALLLKAEDRWGNPAEQYRGSVEISAPGLILPEGNFIEFDEEESGVRRITGAVFTEAGATSISAEDTYNRITTTSNQIRISKELPALKLFWGDPHSGQIADPAKIGNYFDYAHEVSGLDFAGYQRNDSAHSTDAYEIQQIEEKKYYEPGRFVPLPGFEWSGDLAAGGHHNVYFGRYDLPMKRWSGADRLGRDGESDLPHVRDLHDFYRGTDTIITPHVGGQHADLQWHDPTLEPAVEVTSTHGSFEWILLESIGRGYQMGFVGGNDCHTGRPGDDRPGHQLRRYSKGGLTGVYAEELTLSGVLDAIKAKRIYATTGARIRASHTVDGHFIGEKYSSEATAEIKVNVEGTGPLERIEVYRGLKLIHTEQFGSKPSGSRVRVLWDGASRMSSYSGVIWDGFLEVSNGSIGDVETIRFDSPRSRFDRESGSRLGLNSWACGYPSGVIVDVDIDSDTEITVVLNSGLIIGEKFGRHGEVAPRRMAVSEADSVRITATLNHLKERPAKVDLGHLNRSVTLELAPESGTDRADFTVTDNDVQPGVNPYWVKVVQQDMEMAWLSPIFADRTATR
jgi:hypothetical protein